MEDYHLKIRVSEEADALKAKISSLKIFIENKDVFYKLKFKSAWLLLMQYWYMNKYLKILNKRIKLFN